MPVTRSALMGLLVIVSLLSGQAAVAAPLSLSPAARLDLQEAVSYLEDAEGRLTIDELLRSERAAEWAPNGDATFNRGFDSSAWWLKLELENASDSQQRRLLELAYAVLDFVDVYVVADGRVLREYRTGDARPFDSRPLDSRFFLFPVEWQPGERLTVYFRIQTSSAVQAPLVLWQEQAYGTRAVHTGTVHGMYFGGMLLIVLYNFLIFIGLRDRSYLYYVGFIASMPLFFAALSGHGYRYLWPDFSVWNGQAMAVFIASSIFFGALFTRNFLDVPRISRSLNRLLQAVAIVGAAMLVLSFFVPYKISISVLVPLSILACMVDLTTGLFAWRRRVSAAPIYVIAWGFFLIGSITMALNKSGVLPTNLFTEYADQIGTVLEALLLSFAMAQRIATERRLRFAAQEETLRTQRQLADELEQRVAVRTAELASLNRVLQELSDTDQLTQLKNRRYLETAGEREWQHCQRYRHPLAVLLMDVDHFKQVNDRYGHAAGDACLQQVATRLLECLRSPSDIVARYGGEEFCLVLPETDAQGALTVAERIRKLVADQPTLFDDQAIRLTASIGVSSVQPAAGGSLEATLNTADQALYEAKTAGRDRVVMHGVGGRVAET